MCSSRMCFESVNKLPSFLSASNVDIDNHQVRSEAFHICEIFKNLAEQMNLEAKFLKKNREQLSDIFVILKNNNTPVHLPLLFSRSEERRVGKECRYRR